MKPSYVFSLLFRTCVGVALLFTAGVTAVDAQQYIISTYAGGAPALPTAAQNITTDASGSVYFVDGSGHGYYSGPALSNTVFKIDPSGRVTRIAGNSRTGFSGDGGAATNASLYAPRDVAADRAGSVFIADAGNHRVRRVSPDGIITTVAGGGTVLGDGGPATQAQLNYPWSLALDNRGNLFIGELGRVRKLSADGTITTVAGGGPNSPRDGGPATSANLSGGLVVAVDGAGNLFISEQNYDEESESYGQRLLKVSAEGFVSPLPPSFQFCCNADITADAAGNLFISAGPDVWKISPSGARTVVAGSGIYGMPSGDGQLATKAVLNGPTAVAVNAAGDLFIADDFGRSIRKITGDGIIRPVVSIPNSATIVSGDGGPAINAQLQLAITGVIAQSGLAADSAGNLYIAETGAHRVRKVSSSGIITTVAGVGASSRCGPGAVCPPLNDGGPAINAALSYPTSVAVDSAGNLFIADSSNLRVRKVSPDGIITTVAGNGIAPPWPRVAVDGAAATDTPVLPTAVAVDDVGNLYFSEGNYASLRKVSPDGTISTVPLSNTTLPQFGIITALTVDRTGNLFIAGYTICGDDYYCSVSIRQISPAGTITLIAANPPSFASGGGVGDGGPASSAQLTFISNLAVDFAGNLFLDDLHGQRIRKIDLNGIITTVGGNGIPSYSGDGGPATNATLNYPLGLTTDAAGNIYSSDFNQAVRVLRPAVAVK